MPTASQLAPTHSTDADCAGHIDADGVCAVCNVAHGDPCPECAGRGYHVDGCSEIEAAS